MIDAIYRALADFGYAHPLHPACTHLVIGSVMAGFVFSVLAGISGRDTFRRTAHHCMLLALIATIPTALLGFGDWEQRYGGALLLPIRMKIVLAGVLFIFLIAAVIVKRRSKDNGKLAFPIYSVCLLCVAALGYYGGELVYGPTSAAGTVQKEEKTDPMIHEGEAVFVGNCSGCHYADRTDRKAGPGLKELFAREKLSVTGKPVTEESVREQIVSPNGTMPSFASLPEHKIDALIAYLKTL